jgi:putative membrane protein (TIGR04086 family)
VVVSHNKVYGDIFMKKYLGLIWNSVVDVAYVIMSMLIGYALDVALLFALAFAVYRLRLADNTIGLLVHGIYIFGGAVSGLILSLNKKLRGYAGHIRGMKLLLGSCSGLIYAGILLVLSLFLTGSDAYLKTQWLAIVLMALSGGILGAQALRKLPSEAAA